MKRRIKSLDRTFMMGDREIFIVELKLKRYFLYLFDIEDEGLFLYDGLNDWKDLLDLQSDRSRLIIKNECDVI